MDPRGTSSSKWDCFASYRLSIVHPLDDSKTIHRTVIHGIGFPVRKNHRVGVILPWLLPYLIPN